jgi:hypothetical protein
LIVRNFTVDNNTGSVTQSVRQRTQTLHRKSNTQR